MGRAQVLFNKRKGGRGRGNAPKNQQSSSSSAEKSAAGQRDTKNGSGNREDNIHHGSRNHTNTTNKGRNRVPHYPNSGEDESNLNEASVDIELENLLMIPTSSRTTVSSSTQRMLGQEGSEVDEDEEIEEVTEEKTGEEERLLITGDEADHRSVETRGSWTTLNVHSLNRTLKGLSLQQLYNIPQHLVDTLIDIAPKEKIPKKDVGATTTPNDPAAAAAAAVDRRKIPSGNSTSDDIRASATTLAQDSQNHSPSSLHNTRLPSRPTNVSTTGYEGGDADVLDKILRSRSKSPREDNEDLRSSSDELPVVPPMSTLPVVETTRSTDATTESSDDVLLPSLSSDHTVVNGSPASYQEQDDSAASFPIVPSPSIQQVELDISPGRIPSHPIDLSNAQPFENNTNTSESSVDSRIVASTSSSRPELYLSGMRKVIFECNHRFDQDDTGESSSSIRELESNAAVIQPTGYFPSNYNEHCKKDEHTSAPSISLAVTASPNSEDEALDAWLDSALKTASSFDNNKEADEDWLGSVIHRT